MRVQLNLKDCFVSNCCGKTKDEYDGPKAAAEEAAAAVAEGSDPPLSLINSRIDLSSEAKPCSPAAAAATRRKERNTQSL